MKLSVRYLAQLKLAAGRAGEELDVPAPTPAGRVLACLAERHVSLRPLLLTEQGTPCPPCSCSLATPKSRPRNWCRDAMAKC